MKKIKRKMFLEKSMNSFNPAACNSEDGALYKSKELFFAFVKYIL